MKRKLTLTALVIAASLPMAVLAQGGYQDSTPRTDSAQPQGTPGGSTTPDATGTMKSGDTSSMFKELDRDKDGQISKDEAKRSADMQARFDEIDANRDGKVSMNEWNSSPKRKVMP
ncbi:EF-hand domain-containing protein [Aromatoleum sp.]|uniref:EF-hand domain-containing protein n=1 Tax=Aromatoleum sp. TaxID=2307007 RepID=UPI002FC7FA6B